MKYVLVSGGVISGVGKGIIGMLHTHNRHACMLACSRIASTLRLTHCSLVYWIVAEDPRSEGLFDQGRSLSQCRRWDYEPQGAW